MSITKEIGKKFQAVVSMMVGSDEGSPELMMKSSTKTFGPKGVHDSTDNKDGTDDGSDEGVPKGNDDGSDEGSPAGIDDHGTSKTAIQENYWTEEGAVFLV